MYEEDNSPETCGEAAVASVAAALLSLACCANMPYYREKYAKEEKQPQRIEHQMPLPTNSVYYVESFFDTKNRCD